MFNNRINRTFWWCTTILDYITARFRQSMLTRVWKKLTQMAGMLFVFSGIIIYIKCHHKYYVCTFDVLIAVALCDVWTQIHFLCYEFNWKWLVVFHCDIENYFNEFPWLWRDLHPQYHIRNQSISLDMYVLFPFLLCKDDSRYYDVIKYSIVQYIFSFCPKVIKDYCFYFYSSWSWTS